MTPSVRRWRVPDVALLCYLHLRYGAAGRILASGPCSGCDRIKPTQTAKPRKIPVCGAKRKSMFHSQRSEMSVQYEIAMHARQRQKFAQQLGVPFRWLRYPCRFAGEPCLYLPPRITNRFGMFEHARISHQPHESDHAGPRETDRARTVQLLIEPVARYLAIESSPPALPRVSATLMYSAPAAVQSRHHQFRLPQGIGASSPAAS